MEKGNVENVEQKNNGYFLGIIGALIGGIIATIPWILMYVYGNMMLSALAVIIALGEFYGYKIFKGKIDNKLPIIITILAIVIVSVATLVVIPLLLLHNEGLKISMDSLAYIYSYKDFSTAIIKDFIIAVLFTALGSSVVTANIKKQLNNGQTDDMKLDLNNSEELKKNKKEAIDLIKPIFEKYEATSKEKAMLKQEVIAEIENKNQANQSFKYLKNLGIIKKNKGKYYYDAENEEKANQNKTSKKTWIIFGIAFVVILAISIIFQSTPDVTEVSNDDVQFEISSTWNVLYPYEEAYGWDYYRYINTLPSTDENVETNTIDYEHYPARINVFYTQMLEEYKYNNVSEMTAELKEYYENELQVTDYSMTEGKSDNGYDMVTIINKDDNYYDCAYYLLNDDNVAYVTGFSYNADDAEQIQKEVESIANSFEWKN